jgi:molybdate transport system ATP-binding protein
VLDDPDADVFVPSHERSVGMVFQDYALFAHLDAVENVAFGLRARGTPRRVARETAREWLARVGMSAHARSLPHQLSGGQQPRAALARALCGAPDVLLLDEPLSALDAAARPEIRSLLAQHVQEFDGVTIVVTHDRADAEAFRARRVVLDHGRLVS